MDREFNKRTSTPLRIYKEWLQEKIGVFPEPRNSTATKKNSSDGL
jgi:hypothetical protein